MKVYSWLVKTLHSVYLTCKDSTACTWLVKTPQRDFFFCTLSGFLIAFLASFVHQLSQCRQPLAVFSTQLCKTHMLRRPSCAVLRVLHCQELSSFHVLNLHRQCTWRMSFWASMHVSANSECKLTFLSVTRTYVRTYIARIDPSFEALRLCARQLMQPLKFSPYMFLLNCQMKWGLVFWVLFREYGICEFFTPEYLGIHSKNTIIHCTLTILAILSKYLWKQLIISCSKRAS